MRYIYQPGDKVTSYFTYVGEDKEKSTTNHRYMKVKCICGTEESMRTDNILNDVSCKKCGQLKRRATFSNKTKESIIKRIYNSYKKQAIKRGYYFELTYEVFKEYIFKDCYYCSTPPSNKATQNYRSLIYNGIDRAYLQDSPTDCSFAKKTLIQSWKDYKMIVSTRHS
jgi:hypothetical protein